MGYSLGAWVINDWLLSKTLINYIKWDFKNKDLWKYIRAVELYGDPLWYRFGPAFPADPPETYKGLARHTGRYANPYKNNPQGPPDGELAKRWQSRCLVGDAICGEGYKGWDALIKQIDEAKNCSSCWHDQYHRPATGLTTKGAKFLALKTFPDVFEKDYPTIPHYETSVEGDYVYFRLYYTNSLNPQNDPLNKVNGFGFVGINGSGWGEEEHPFSNLYWARYRPGFNRVDYPFNHLCSTQPENKSDVEAWVLVLNPDGSIRDGSPGVPIHMTCSAPKEVITPFFDH